MTSPSLLPPNATGLERALEDAGAVYDLVENPGGAHHTLRIEVRNALTLLSAVAGLRRQVDAAMRASVHWTLVVERGLCAEIALAGGVGAAHAVLLEVGAP